MTSGFKDFIYGNDGTLQLLGIDHVLLGHKAGIAKTSISEYMRGLHKPSRATVAKIAEALGWSLEHTLSQLETAEPSTASGKPVKVRPRPTSPTVPEKRANAGIIPECQVCGYACPGCLAAAKLRNRLRSHLEAA